MVGNKLPGNGMGRGKAVYVEQLLRSKWNVLSRIYWLTTRKARLRLLLRICVKNTVW